MNVLDFPPSFVYKHENLRSQAAPSWMPMIEDSPARPFLSLDASAGWVILLILTALAASACLFARG